MVSKAHIHTHMEVVDSMGHCIGHVDQMEGEDRIRLTKPRPKESGHEHVIPMEWVASTTGGRLHLNRTLREVENVWD